MKIYHSLLCFLILGLAGCGPENNPNIDYVAYRAHQPVIIDGEANEEVWAKAKWHHISERWLGEPFTEDDFSGRFKLSWDEDFLYVLAEITDDSLFHQYEGSQQYWDNDNLEIFVDEDASGGDHQYNYNAFAYHIDKNYNVYDLDRDSSAYLFNNHLKVKRTKSGNIYTWEVAIRIYDDSFRRGIDNSPVTLVPGKKMGFAIAYCDNDASATRENFIGSEVVEGEDKNRGWIDAGIFGRLVLRE